MKGKKYGYEIFSDDEDPHTKLSHKKENQETNLSETRSVKSVKIDLIPDNRAMIELHPLNRIGNANFTKTYQDLDKLEELQIPEVKNALQASQKTLP